MRTFGRGLLPWVWLCFIACDPSLRGFDRVRPIEAGTDARIPSVTDPRHPDAHVVPPVPSTEVPPTPREPRECGPFVPERDSGSLDASLEPDSHSGIAEGGRCTTGITSPAGATVRSAFELGLMNRPARVYNRDGAASGMLGGTPLWVFHDTYLTAPAEDGSFARHASAAAGSLAHPDQVSEALDGQGAPMELLPLTAQEMAIQAADGGAQRVTLWPNSVVEDGTSGLIFYLKAILNPGFLFDYFGVGVARIAPGSTVAKRDATLLFGSDEPKFDVGAVVVGDYLYLYACGDSKDAKQPCYVTRASSGSWATRSGYRFWDGCEWTPDVTRAAVIMDSVPGELTVSYNRYLGKYLATYTPFSPVNDATFRTAPRPEGPWSAPFHAFEQVAPDPKLNVVRYGAKEHPEFAQDDGKTILVTYPVQLADGRSNEIHLVSVTFD
jgi:hypothetical protein